MIRLLCPLILFSVIGCSGVDKRPIIRSMRETLQKNLEDYESGKFKLGPLATKARVLRIKTDIEAAKEAEK